MFRRSAIVISIKSEKKSTLLLGIISIIPHLPRILVSFGNKTKKKNKMKPFFFLFFFLSQTGCHYFFLLAKKNLIEICVDESSLRALINGSFGLLIESVAIPKQEEQIISNVNFWKEL